MSRVAALRGDAAAAAAFDDAARHLGTLASRAFKDLLATPAAAFPPTVAAAVTAMAAEGPAAVAVKAEARLPRDLASLARRTDVALDGLPTADLHVAGDLLAAWHDRPADAAAPMLAAMRDNQPRIAIGRALGAVDTLVDTLARAHPGLPVQVTGGLRRFEITVGDLLLLTHGVDARADLVAWAARLPEHDVRRQSASAVTFAWDGEEVTLRVVDDDALAGALIHFSGSRAHVAQLAERARIRDLRLTPAGLERAGGGRIAVATEADIYAALDLPWIPAERRHGGDEIALAERGALGTPVALADIQGDLHTHTHWSDGRDQTETVIQSARALGYRYVAITDHSPSARASRTLTLERLEEQSREIAALRPRYPEITILHGCEVDILADGSLDLPDAVMAGLDIVLASLHESHGHDGAQLTERYLRAMASPYVSIVTHPANRAPGRTSGYALDWDRFFAAARDTGTAVEIDGAPGHLDLDGHLARQAVERGATVVIDSDGHFAERLGRQMRMGIGLADRGGVEARHVLNTRGLDGVRAFIAGKRQRVV